ncbi:MAG: 2Fe-2S iron-sulfur cluster binding domain-containing protein [Hyphomicrobiaceae bacterium]|nr:MAG: 2Fe-2S iron-sulfur cluster binding domain-containing protein [Hyphomicrobiaceae bacterium]
MTTREFRSLLIKDVTPETEEAVSVTFDVPGGLAEDFRFKPGQHVALRLRVDGIEQQRNYSICSAPSAEGTLKIGVKRVAGGRFSQFVSSQLKAGDRVDVMLPTGRFFITPDPSAAKSYLAIATGSGITPVLSIIAAILEGEPQSRVVLLFGNRETKSIMFRSVLEDLKDRFIDRLVVLHALSREHLYSPVLSGRIDAQKISAVLKSAFPGRLPDMAFLCGPTPVLKLARAALESAGMPRERVKHEIFFSQAPRTAPPAVPADAAVQEIAPPYASARIRLNGREKVIPIAAGETIIEAATRAGLEAPFACKGGMCSSCRAKLVEGKVEMEVNYALEPWELDAGFVLTCQSRPTTKRIAVDYDAR